MDTHGSDQGRGILARSRATSTPDRLRQPLGAEPRASLSLGVTQRSALVSVLDLADAWPLIKLPLTRPSGTSINTAFVCSKILAKLYC